MNISSVNNSTFGKITKVPQLFFADSNVNHQEALLEALKNIELTIKDEEDRMSSECASKELLKNAPIILKQLNETRKRLYERLKVLGWQPPKPEKKEIPQASSLSNNNLPKNEIKATLKSIPFKKPDLPKKEIPPINTINKKLKYNDYSYSDLYQWLYGNNENNKK